MPSNYLTVLKPTSKKCPQLVHGPHVQLVLKFKFSRPVKWPLTFGVGLKPPQKLFLTSVNGPHIQPVLNKGVSCIHCSVQNSLKFQVEAASFGKYLEPQEINAGFSAQN